MYGNTHWGSWLILLNRFIELRPAIMHFIEHADRKDSVPKAKGHTPKYSAWVFSDNDWNMMEIIRDALKVAGHAQQSFSRTSKASSAPYSLSVYEGLITTWEGMRKNPKYTYIYDALDAGIAIMGKYYDETDMSPLAVLSTVLDPMTKDSYINHYFAPQYKRTAMQSVRNVPYDLIPLQDPCSMIHDPTQPDKPGSLIVGMYSAS
ncbi:uncharacterized protein EI90DRAFT_3018937 [Cantharellus anzutake]|uniref:uncharacterized protein n=1 Tax=Cantharellus anzutake TaxID=1750568 RepID=UPI0019083DFE|nr:uncharacterized protein EI90DRAFT_3018937 [Cantharellus anzutake]KAF8325888.1 hypothetical protein EI90DRAFT_3018937 [Cantharellus anzutake]